MTLHAMTAIKHLENKADMKLSSDASWTIVGSEGSDGKYQKRERDSKVVVDPPVWLDPLR